MKTDTPASDNADYVLENYIAVDSKFSPTLWDEPQDLVFSYMKTNAESYYSHLNAEFYVKHPNMYVFVDVVKKIQQSTYVSINSISQQARKSKYERDTAIQQLSSSLIKFNITSISTTYFLPLAASQ